MQYRKNTAERSAGRRTLLKLVTSAGRRTVLKLVRSAGRRTLLKLVTSAGRRTLLKLVRNAGTTLLKVVRCTGRTLLKLLRSTGRTLLKLVRNAGTTLLKVVRCTGRTLLKLLRSTGRTLLKLVRNAGTTLLKVVRCVGRTLLKLLRSTGITLVKLVRNAWTTLLKVVRSAQCCVVVLLVVFPIFLLPCIERPKQSNFPTSTTRKKNYAQWAFFRGPCRVIPGWKVSNCAFYQQTQAVQWPTQHYKPVFVTNCFHWEGVQENWKFWTQQGAAGGIWWGVLGGLVGCSRKKKSSTKAAKPYPLDLSRHDFQNRKTLSLDRRQPCHFNLSVSGQESFQTITYWSYSICFSR